MNYDFDEVIVRKSTNSLKWEVSENELPMRAADKDFKTAPCVIEAVTDRAMQHSSPAVVQCLYKPVEKRHGFEI